MRRSLQPLAVLLVSLLIIGALVAIAVTPPADNSDPSSRSAGRLGTLALYTWLSDLGLDVSRVSGTFDLHGSDVLVEYDPTADFSPADLTAAIAFVRGGGDIILAFDRDREGQAAPLLRRLSIRIGPDQPAGTAMPAQPFVPANDVHAVPMGPGVALAEQQPLVALLRERGAVVAGAVAAGEGRAYVLGSPEALSNDGLRHGDSAYLVLGLLARARGGHIAFDEVHHGEVSGAAGAPGIFEGPIGVASVLAVALVLVALALSGRRLGRPVAAADTIEVPSATAYVSAMGDLFARSRQRGMIATRYADELKRAIGRATGVAPALDDAAFVAALEAAGGGPSDRVAALLRRARELETGSPDEQALLLLARDVAVAEQDWALTPQLRR
ncbi:MAG TPA: DUF4350 domain-containing protein [Candidatus Dormibacteraeota bacterium]